MNPEPHVSNHFMIDFTGLLDYAFEQRLYDSSYHGLEHWHQVEFNGLLLASRTGADITVVRLFALFHDCRRMDDAYDVEHGARAVEFIDRCLAEKRFELDEERLEKLRRACRLHTKERQTGDITIDTCFDADRLDLGRVGICPMEEKMATDAGKKIARKLAQAGISVFHQREWIRNIR